MNLKVYEINYDETLTAAGSVAGEIVSYEVVFSDQGPEGPIGPQGPAGTTDYNDLVNVPTEFPPEAHASTHLAAGSDPLYDQDLNTDDSVEFADIVTDKVAFDLAAAIAVAEGEVAWNNEEETLDVGMAHGDVLQVGQEVLYHVENATASQITKGTLCMFAGTVGNSGKIRVKPWDGSQPQKTIVGLATTTIAAGVGEMGYVNHFGKVRGINANGSLYSETWVNGDILFARPFGGLTKYPAYILVGGAGSTGINGEYSLRGMSSGKPYYNKVGSANSTTINAIYWETGVRWVISGSGEAYVSGEDVASPDLVSSWEETVGLLPVPQVLGTPEKSTIVAAVISNNAASGTLLVRITAGIDLARIGASQLFHTHQPNEVSGSEDLEITDSAKGVILRSPDSTRWRITIDNDGVLISTPL